MKVSSWGGLDTTEHHVMPIYHGSDLHPLPTGSALPAGLGRSYGDVGLNAGNTLWQMQTLDRLIAFDPQSGVLTCQAGVNLGTIQQLMSPRGWRMPVTPGTQWVTVGGAIANDVHGKNHHRQGSLGAHLQRIVLWRTDGKIIECGPHLRSDWWAATVGGLGLTGVIVEADIQLEAVPGPWIEVETLPFSNLDEFFLLSDQSEAHWEHTVAWVDCGRRPGRGAFFRGNAVAYGPQGSLSEQSWRIPLTPPFSLVNRFSSGAFNELYFSFHRLRQGKRVIHYRPFFYPLDSVSNWNRLYGPRGFYQYQCVLPRNSGSQALQAILHTVARRGQASPLTVLKTFGPHPPVGMLSFAQPGVTLAIDFPNQGSTTLKLLDDLDLIVQQAGGKLYPAKDARMPRSLFEQTYPRLAEFLSYRDGGISSSLSRRLMGY